MRVKCRITPEPCTPVSLSLLRSQNPTVPEPSPKKDSAPRHPRPRASQSLSTFYIPEPTNQSKTLALTCFATSTILHMIDSTSLATVVLLACASSLLLAVMLYPAALLRWFQRKRYQYEVTFSLYMLTSTEKFIFSTSSQFYHLDSFCGHRLPIALAAIQTALDQRCFAKDC